MMFMWLQSPYDPGCISVGNSTAFNVGLVDTILPVAGESQNRVREQ